MKTRHIALLLGLCALMLTPGCIRNDIPYPVVLLEILGIEGEGFTCTVRDIDPVTHTATLQLEETTDIARVTITGVTLTEGAEPSRPLTGTFDLRSPLYVTLSLYQDYDWTIRAEQTVERSFRVAQQVGETEFDLKNRIARARVPEGEVDLTDVHVTELKLGPRDITTIDPPKEELTDFTSVRYVEVSYQDVRHRGSLYVSPTDVTVQLTGADAWTSVIWLSGTGLSGTEMGFRYRRAGEETWLEVPDVTVTGSTFTARLAAEPETEYQVLAYSGDKQTDLLTVRTQEARQVTNSGFEDWCSVDDIIYPYAPGASPYWGTGNVGASLGSAVLTDKTTDTRPGSEGLYAARLESKTVIGKFAAGNLFIGKYAATRGTNGIITFGAPFTCRPTGLRIWVKYTQGSINKIDKVPAGVTIRQGDPDTGIVYIALGTWTAEEYGYTEDKGVPTRFGTDESPICIDTRNVNTFFKPDGKDVVAYGEQLMTSTVGEWTQYTIPLDYRTTAGVPTHIMIVCSASRYGDYFTGSTDSRMWVDDFELLYE